MDISFYKLYRKLIVFAFILALPAGYVSAQQKVRDNTSQGQILPTKDAILELESTNKGLLHVRLPLVRTSDPYPMTSHIAGMMVYNN